jgi:hypothetical protein
MNEQDLLDAWRVLTDERRNVVREAVLFALRAEKLHRDIADRMHTLMELEQRMGISVGEDTHAETPRAKVLRREPS